VANVEVGLAFTLVGLATGMIWARIIWGIWWTWDARLTWAFITCLIYAGYLMMRNAIDEPTARARYAGVLCIFAFTSVVITFKAIEWWRTQHPAPVLSIRTGGGRMDPAMESILYQNWFALMLIAAVMTAIRMRQEGVQREVESLRRQVHALTA
jgi:heme exporter protein C